MGSIAGSDAQRAIPGHPGIARCASEPAIDPICYGSRVTRARSSGPEGLASLVLVLATLAATAGDAAADRKGDAGASAEVGFDAEATYRVATEGAPARGPAD